VSSTAFGNGRGCLDISGYREDIGVGLIKKKRPVVEGGGGGGRGGKMTRDTGLLLDPPTSDGRGKQSLVNLGSKNGGHGRALFPAHHPRQKKCRKSGETS